MLPTFFKKKATLMVILFTISTYTLAQEIKFKNSIRYEKIKPDSIGAINEFSNTLYKNNYYIVLQFDKIPTPSTLQNLKSAGVELLDYIPKNAYWAKVSSFYDFSLLKNEGVISLIKLSNDAKLDAAILSLMNNSLNTEPSKKIIVNIQLFKGIHSAVLKEKLLQEKIEIKSTQYENGGILTVEIALSKIYTIASLPYVVSIHKTTGQDIPLNNLSRAVHGVYSLNTAGGRNLNGNGVVIGVGDNDDASSHIDLADRVINRSGIPPQTFSHGLHVAGTISGGGLKDETYKGMAPGSTLIGQYFSGILSNTPTYILDFNMIATNNSYHSVEVGCEGVGDYDELSNYIDAQIKANDKLSHVFAVGNDGDEPPCVPYPASFQTVKSGWQSAKNVISVGAVIGQYYGLEGYSSKGPTKDGRIKPEIVAAGSRVFSTINGNNYGYNYGTSMAAPAVTGVIGLLTERYRQLHGNANPKGALMKALICNSADDMGNPGPDYGFGFGWMNARKAVEDLEANTYFIDNISNTQLKTHSITVPAGVKQLKVLLYWHDKEAATMASTTLINDIDLTVSDGSNTFQPWILNATPAGVNNNAVRGVDHVNNIEQVTIDNPTAGNYTINVNGFAIPQGLQEYVVVYEMIMPVVQVEFPIGGETFVPGTQEYLQWRAYDGSTNTFTLEYSTNNGSSWTTIKNDIAGDVRYFLWDIPAAVQTTQALIRVTRNGTSLSHQSNAAFTILNVPASFTVANLCEGAVQLTWASVNGATDYEIFQKQGAEMKRIGTTGSLSFNVYNLPIAPQWFSVRARLNGVGGKRAEAISITPNGGTCTDGAFDNDLKMVAVVSPLTGRQFTSTQLTTQSIKVRIKNLDNVATGVAYAVSYRVNGGTINTENVSTVIAAGASNDFTFSSGFDFSAIGTYLIEAWVKNTGDVQVNNDTVKLTIKQLGNAPINLPLVEGFETADAAVYTDSIRGLRGLDRFDFISNTAFGRARTFVNSNFQFEGSRALTLDNAMYKSTASINYLTATFNLSSYTSNMDGLRMDGYYRSHQQNVQANNFIWIRGSDDKPWIPAYNLSSNANADGSFKLFKGINIDDLLSSNGQSVSSSFQVRFGQQGNSSANNNTYAADETDIDDGYTFDNIRILQVVNDIEIKAVLSPTIENCNAATTSPFTISITNNSNTPQSNIKAGYRLQGGAVVEEIIPLTISPKTTVNYTFTNGVLLSAPGYYSFDAWCTLSTDSYHLNDTLYNYSIRVNSLINNFPYLESFESSDGNWYASEASSWAWGTPAKTIINKTANGTKAWVTKLTGNYNNNELSYLYSPCFNLSAMTQPVLSFSHIFKTEDDCDCDYHWIEYSTDGINWTKLGTANNGTNWYDNVSQQKWQASKTKWHVASIDIPSSGTSVRFRFVFNSDPAVAYDGVGIDDIHIFDKAQIYTGASNPTITAQNVSGNNWFHFNDANGNRIVSIHPQGQSLGATSVNVYINSGAVRFTDIQYYHNRNIVIRPTNTVSGNVKIRYYFTDAEANTMINATGCTGCTSIKDAYEAGVTQYSAIVASEENGTLADNTNQPGYQFILPGNVYVAPYDTGYYAEYEVNHFSEFWINNGGPQNNQSLSGSFPTSVSNTSNTKNFIRYVSSFNKQLLIATGTLNTKKMQVQIFDMAGKIIYSNVFNYQPVSIVLKNVAGGLYILKIEGDKKEQFFGKVFVE